MVFRCCRFICIFYSTLLYLFLFLLNNCELIGHCTDPEFGGYRPVGSAAQQHSQPPNTHPIPHLASCLRAEMPPYIRTERLMTRRRTCFWFLMSSCCFTTTTTECSFFYRAIDGFLVVGFNTVTSLFSPPNQK